MIQSNRCPECGSVSLIWNKKKGEVICRDCGLVLDDTMIDFSQEWREMEDDEDKQRRAGAPMTYTQYDRGLGTEVGTRADLSLCYPTRGGILTRASGCRRTIRAPSSKTERLYPLTVEFS